ncbi:ribose 5-phosphate isomerase B [Pelomyxa schiedti]|nr:ribose 5-phosphate isomerase B [Pelomyxa schiedti]
MASSLTTTGGEGRIIIGCDHGAYDLKLVVMAYLRECNYDVVDVGCFNNARVDYPDIALAVCTRVVSGEFKMGIVLCGTGIGISIACNKVKGIRCALCHDHYTAIMARQHNDANVLALGGRVTGPEVAKDIVKAFLAEKFAGLQHTARLTKIANIEATGSC